MMPVELIEASERLMPTLRTIWREGEVPLRTHERDRYAADGTPAITDAFSSWLAGHRTRTERRTRLSWAMRKLRDCSPREFDVMYRAFDTGESAERTTKWLNDRCEKNRIPFRYTVEDTRLIRAAAIDKLLRWA